MWVCMKLGSLETDDVENEFMMSLPSSGKQTYSYSSRVFLIILIINYITSLFLFEILLYLNTFYNDFEVLEISSVKKDLFS